MDITSGSSSTSDAEKRSSNVSHSPPTGASQVTFPMNGSTGSQEITAGKLVTLWVAVINVGSLHKYFSFWRLLSPLRFDFQSVKNDLISFG